ncbi:DUF2075 domain-containing protein [Streptomyces sp. DSM 41524]|uniref:DUF2075 domain-containing protein n=1 Tax=Streptomyces asiaticus subsp. ignotus TaxID=3098222 RepID=A0ABU7Q2K6_9ACTN|nr:DUF2075 domain-containing protein [Streptomyces sp. DSM 41524]
MPLLRLSGLSLLERGNAGVLVRDLTERYRSVLFQDPSPREQRSWGRSLAALAEVLRDAALGQVEVLIEQRLPLSSLRADAVLAGVHPETGKPSYVVVELKQWSAARLVPSTDDLCRLGVSDEQALLHPVAQVRRYCDCLQNFTSVLESGNYEVSGIAYLHNADDRNVAELFRLPDARAQLFTKTTRGALVEHLRRCLAPAAGALAADFLLESPREPSRPLMNAAADEIIDGGEFALLDGQQVAFSLVKRAVELSRESDRKEVIVVSGGPGSGKSVIAAQVMGHLGRSRRSVVHATGSKSFTTTLRTVVGRRNGSIAELFKYFNSFSAAERNGLDVLICDEAHRIRELSHTGQGRQIDELLDAARVPVFLLDDYQGVRPREMGSVKKISDAAAARGHIVRHVDLNGQFRCGGSRAYEYWVLRLLGLEPGGPLPWANEENFQVYVADSPQEMEDFLRERQEAGLTARMTAGFCWEWNKPKADGTLVRDVAIGEWRRPWNVDSERSLNGAPASSLWATDPAGFGQIGCIYTAQGFEYAWNGVIFGKDLVWTGDTWRGNQRENRDTSVAARTRPAEFQKLIRHTYKVLLTRGLAGTVLYSDDPDTQAMLRELVNTDIRAPWPSGDTGASPGMER